MRLFSHENLHLFFFLMTIHKLMFYLGLKIYVMYIYIYITVLLSEGDIMVMIV